jgi:hypothetical protein
MVAIKHNNLKSHVLPSEKLQFKKSQWLLEEKQQ